MKVNERRTVVGVDWPLCVPPPNRGERSTPLLMLSTLRHVRIDRTELNWTETCQFGSVHSIFVASYTPSDF